jgi:hypothetical protein
MPIVFDSTHERTITQAQADYLLKNDLIQNVDIDYLLDRGGILNADEAEYPITANSSEEAWYDILTTLDEADRLACPKCGWSYDVHNDDGSCVDET